MEHVMRKYQYLTTAFVLGFALSISGCTTAGSSGAGPDGAGANGGMYADGQGFDELRERRFADGSIPTAEGEGIFRDVHFGYDSSEINDIARQNIEYNVQILQQNPEIRVQLEGHTDERGTAEYNMALGQRRARAVYDVLLSYGIPKNRVETISYGEEVPLDEKRDEQAFSRNRRAHFSAFRNLPKG
jgi:peptidoglycan-associated lipoprotein